MHIPPLGLLYVGDALKKAGYEVEVFHLSTEQIHEYVLKILAKSPLFVGFSVFTGEAIRACAEMCREIKRNSKIPIVWGNAHPSLLPHKCLSEEYIDFVVIGEGEVTAVELAQALEKKREIVSVKGVGYRDANGIRINEPRAFIRNLDEFTMDWTLVDVERYLQGSWELRRMISFVTSRGCPDQCGFCYNLAFNKRRWRAHSVDFVVSQIQFLKDKWGVDGVFYWDDNFFANKERAFEILERVNLPYYAEARVDYINEGFVRKLSQTGCRLLLLGIESGSDRVLKLINKKQTVSDNINAVRIMPKYPTVRISGSIMFGFPTETREEYRDTLQMVLKMFEINRYMDFTTGFYMPYPGTDLYDLAIQQGFVPPSSTEDWEDMNRWNDKVEISWVEWLSSKEAREMRQRILILGTLYRYNIPVFKELLRWRIEKECYRLDIDIKLLVWLRHLFSGGSKTILARLGKALLRRYWEARARQNARSLS